jgi:hypothetical protein
MTDADNLNMNSFNPAVGIASSECDSMRESFFEWLSNGHAKKYAPTICLSCLDKISDYAKEKKICAGSLWTITKHGIFKLIYLNLLDSKMLRVTDINTYKVFIVVGKLYLKFLKNNRWMKVVNESADASLNNIVPETAILTKIAGASNDSVISTTITDLPLDIKADDAAMSETGSIRNIMEKKEPALTIKDAVIKILSATVHPMTADEIYNKIIKHRLYAFGAQNPVNVVRNIIESACYNSGYSEKYRAVVPCFHFERNSSGKKVYCLLRDVQKKDSPKQDSIVVDALAPSRLNLSIWDNKTEQEFQKWLESQNYAKKTADNYRRATAQTFRNYAVLAQNAVEISNTKLEAVRKYIALLNEDSGFVKTNSAQHNQFTAALAALKRFYKKDKKIIDEGHIPWQPSGLIRIQKNESDTVVILIPDGRKLLVDDIIDLDEAKVEMDNILRTHFAQFYGYSNKRLLFEAVKIALPMFLNDNGFKDEDTVLAVAKHLLGDRYVFYDLHIWQSEPSYPKSVSGLVIGFGRANRGVFAAEDAANYLDKVKIPQYPANIIRNNKGKEAFVLCDNDKIVLAECLNLSDERVSAVYAELHKLFEEHGVREAGFVIPRDISAEWFDHLPNLEAGLTWTPLLLQEIILRYPKSGFKVIFSGLTGQSIYTIASAFTIESSMLHTFADVVHLYLLRKHDFTLPRKMSAEELRLVLREAGMLAGNELIYNLHKALGADHRFAFTENNQTVFIRER